MVSSYVVLARKWRPAQFPDIVGQSVVIRTLNNAIRHNKVHHAYLFTGSRGVGKTSIARIFSKTLRCPTPKDVTIDGFSWTTSCDACSQCKEISASTSVDVLEIDGASHNGVDSIREVREATRYSPSSGEKKIFIIDEVHMLTTAAFNALLKTLEEPPPHVIFIFATTEPHKIPSTILSRCQRFDFKKVPFELIQKRLSFILNAEGYEADEAALAQIARASEGGMRDALSLLDQTLALCEGKITLASVAESLGLIASQPILSLVDAVFQHDPLRALQTTQEVYLAGHDLKSFLRQILDTLHAAILLKLESAHQTHSDKSIESHLTAYCPLSQEDLQQLRTSLQARSLEELELIFQLFHHSFESISKSPQPKLVFDLMVVKAATARLANQLPISAQATNQPTSPLNSSSPITTATQELRNSLNASAPRPAAIFSSPTQPTSSSSNIAPASTRFSIAPPPPPSARAPAASSVAAIATTQPTQAVMPLHPFPWPQWVTFVQSKRPLLGTLLEHVTRTDLRSSPEGKHTLFLYFKAGDSYKKDQVLSRMNMTVLLQLAVEFFHTPIHIEGLLSDQPSEESLAEKRDRERKTHEHQRQQEVLGHPIIRETQMLFGSAPGPIEWLQGNSTRGVHSG